MEATAEDGNSDGSNEDESERRSDVAPPRKAKYARTNGPEQGGASRLLLNCLVKLHVKKVAVNYSHPWKKESQQSSSGSGFVYKWKGQRMVITNAHVVSEATSVLAQRFGKPGKKPAHLVSIAHQLDLAILQVEDAGFWEAAPAVQLGMQLPQLEHAVTCVGFPVGGDNISVTRGVVSRLDMSAACPGVRVGGGRLPKVLSIQIDAAINPGNSGGPVFNQEGEVVGVARAVLQQANNIGYIIPVSVVTLFLNHFHSTGDAMFPGVSSLGLPATQNLESPALRERLAMTSQHEGGIRLMRVDKLGPSMGLVAEDDVLLAINGVAIAEDGTVPLRHLERIDYSYLLHSIPLRQPVALSLLRAGAAVEVLVSTAVDRQAVPLWGGLECQPQYLVVGGLVMMPVTVPWLRDRFGSRKYHHQIPAFLQVMLNAEVEDPSREVIVLSKVLAHNLNFGYHSVGTGVVEHFNGAPVHSLRALVEALHAAEGKFLEFALGSGLAPLGYSDQVRICLDAEECKAAESEILHQFGIAFASDVAGHRYPSAHSPGPLAPPGAED